MFTTIFDCTRPARPSRPFGLGVFAPAIPPVEPAHPVLRFTLEHGPHAGVWASDDGGRLWTDGRRTVTGGVVRAWREAQRRERAERRAIDEAFESGRLAALEDGAPVPPAGWSDDRRGAWICGYGEGQQMLAARLQDHLEELREQAEWSDLCRAGTACW